MFTLLFERVDETRTQPMGVEKGWVDVRGVPHRLKWKDGGENVIHVLSIDFDYWYGGCEIGHCGYCTNCKFCDLERPTAPISKDHRLRTVTKEMVLHRVKPKVPIHISECHANIVGVLSKLRDDNPGAHICVWNIDEHDDVCSYSYPSAVLSCGSWVDYSGVRRLLDEYWWVTSHQHLQQLAAKPHVIYACKSSPYLLKQGDRPFITFIRNLEKRAGRKAHVFGYASRPIQRALTASR